jgi:hypothetical protein
MITSLPGPNQFCIGCLNEAYPNKFLLFMQVSAGIIGRGIEVGDWGAIFMGYFTVSSHLSARTIMNPRYFERNPSERISFFISTSSNLTYALLNFRFVGIRCR